MRQEWRNFWFETFKALRHVLTSIAVALLFFFVYLPQSEPGEIGLVFKIVICISLSVFFGVWLSLTINEAVSTFISIRKGKARPRSSIFRSFSVSFIGMSLGLTLGYWIRYQLIEKEPDYSTLPEYWLIGTFITLVFVFYKKYKTSREENLKLQAAHMESQYHVLKNQMQPHFLFNSLNSLSELCIANPNKAVEVTQKLSDLYREILENSKYKTTSLASEINIVCKYLDLEKIRFGERLKFTIGGTPVGDIKIPSLVLQTLVENAVKHGISKSIEGGEVNLSFHDCENGDVEISVSNSGAELSESKGKGIGIENTISRLSLLYGSNHDFNLVSTEDMTKVSFRIPKEML